MSPALAALTADWMELNWHAPTSSQTKRVSGAWAPAGAADATTAARATRATLVNRRKVFMPTTLDLR